jgi:hypothetical protein
MSKKQQETTEKELHSILVIKEEMLNKAKYFLHKFPNTEWSGPAWYRIDKSDGDFPSEVTLLYFKPLDLGDSTSTELDGEDLGKILPNLYKEKPELKDCALGLIHSHHTLGAFFSQTDKDTALENASKTGLYFSTVVASEKKKCVFGFSYEDRLGFAHFIEGETKKPRQRITIQKDWRKEARAIKKKSDSKPKNSWVNYGYKYYNGNNLETYNGYDYQQADMFGSPATKALNASIVEDEEDMILNAIDSYIIDGNFSKFNQDIKSIDEKLDSTKVLKKYYKENSIRRIGI